MDADSQSIPGAVGGHPKMPQTTRTFGIEKGDFFSFFQIERARLSAWFELRWCLHKRHGVIADHARIDGSMFFSVGSDRGGCQQSQGRNDPYTLENVVFF